MGEKRRRFSEEFKREAVRLAFEGGEPVSQVARELDVRTGHCLHRLKVNSDSAESEHRFRGKVDGDSAGK